MFNGLKFNNQIVRGTSNLGKEELSHSQGGGGMDPGKIYFLMASKVNNLK